MDKAPAQAVEPASTVVEDLSDGPWQRNIVRPLLIVAVSTSLLVGPISLMRTFTREDRVLSLLPFFILVTLQAVYTRHWLANPEHRWFRDVRTRLGEIVLLLVVLRLVVWYIQRQEIALYVLEEWLVDPFSFFDLLFVMGVFLTLMGWGFAAAFTMIFLDLGLAPDELLDYRERGYERAWVQALPSNRQELLDRFGEMWMWGGAFLAFTAALSRVQFNPEPGRLIGLRTLGLAPELVLALVIYFMGGLMLLSYGRLALLRARWQREGSAGIERVTRRWQRNALLAIVGVAALASLLPFGSSFGLALILSALLQIIFLIVTGIMVLITALAAAALSLFGTQAPEQSLNLPTPAPPESPLSPPTLPSELIPPWAAGGLFWLIVIILGLYLVAYFLVRRGLGRRLKALPWLGRLVVWWRRLWGRASEMAGEARRRLRTSTPPSLPARFSDPWRFVRLRGLSPSERTRYFYLSTVRRAGEAGVRRQPAQTPLEYESTLSSQFPQAGSEIAELTGSFLRARYGPRPLDEPEAGRARRAWQEIKRFLRRRRSKDKADEKDDAAAFTS